MLRPMTMQTSGHGMLLNFMKHMRCKADRHEVLAKRQDSVSDKLDTCSYDTPYAPRPAAAVDSGPACGHAANGQFSVVCPAAVDAPKVDGPPTERTAPSGLRRGWEGL
eukprot:scaffold275347_cov27-Prasinocladus_malaysianus.AAC.1